MDISRTPAAIPGPQIRYVLSDTAHLQARLDVAITTQVRHEADMANAADHLMALLRLNPSIPYWQRDAMLRSHFNLCYPDAIVANNLRNIAAWADAQDGGSAAIDLRHLDSAAGTAS